MSEQEAEVTMKAIAEAAQCWCDPETSHIAMDEKLAHAFSHRIQSHLATEEVLRRESHRLRAENEILREALLKIGDIADPQLASEAWMIQIAQDALNRVEEK